MNKIINTLIIGLLIIMSTTLTNGQETTYVEYKNGDKVKVEIKSFHSKDKKIKFKNLETGKKMKVASEDLESIIYIYPNDTLVFKRQKVKAYNPFGKLQNLTKAGWVAKVYGTDKMEGYLYISKDFNISMNAFGDTKSNSFFSSAVAIKIVSEDHIFYAGLSKIDGWGGDRTARILINRGIKKYLKDYCPEFAKKMNKNSYEPSEINNMIDDYTAQCE